MLKQLLPRMFPSARSNDFIRIAENVVTTSGSEVQSATKVVPKNVPPSPLRSAKSAAVEARPANSAAANLASGARPLVRGVLQGLGIREIKDDFDRDTYRVVYTVKLANAIYVLHAFKKKSKFGISTPHHEIELVRKRYLEAQKLDEAYESLSERDADDE